MGYAEAHDENVLAHYEGLIYSTARLLMRTVEDEFEDVQQILRIKAWRALLAYDATRVRIAASSPEEARDKYVFMCVRDQAKDLAKRRKRGFLLIDDLTVEMTSRGGDPGFTRDAFDQRYLSESHEEVYGRAEDDDVLIPNTLDDLEREIVLLLYRDFRQSEAARRLGLGKREMERAMKSIRAKLGDWRPDGAPELVAPPAALAA